VIILVESLNKETEAENIRTEYQVAVNLWGNIVNSSWSRFNAMLVANSVIITAIGVLLTNGHFRFIILSLSAIGFALTISWQSMMDRDAKFRDVYTLSARRLERLIDPRGPVLLGAQLAHGCKIKNVDSPVVCEQYKGIEKEICLEGLASLDIRTNILLIIWSFRLIYIIFFLWASPLLG